MENQNISLTNESSPSVSPRERFREMMRGDILVAARSIIQSGGFAALSMRSLAEAVGMRAPSLYDYFASKDDVLNALYLDAVDTMRELFQTSQYRSTPGVARLIGMGFAYRDYAVAHPDLFQLVYGRVDASYRPGEAQMEASRQLFLNMRDEVSNAIAQGELEPADADELSMTLWAHLHGLASLELAGMITTCVVASPGSVVSRSIASLFFGVLRREKADFPRITCKLENKPAN